MSVLRSTVALTLKEVHHHWIAMVLIAVWSAMMVPIAILSALSGGGTSFAAAATGLAYYYGPVVVFLVVRRLVVQEYEDGTIRFLDALPAPAWLQLLVKWVVGWLATVTIVIGICLPMLGFAALREFVTFGWFLQLCVAISLYITSWLALTLLVAHTGRFRHWIWLSMVVVLGSADLGEGWQHYTWLAALAESADATRHLFPWLDFGISLGWTGLLALFATFLATWHGGSIPAILFKSADTRHRVSGTSWILALYIVVEVWPEVGAGTLNGWEHLPTPSQGVRVAGEVGDWPEAARQTLDDLNALHPLDPPTDLVLAASRATPLWASPGPRVFEDLWDRDQLILRVAESPRTSDRARLVDIILSQRSAGMLDFAMDRGFAVDGLGLFLAEEPGDRELAERRAALAMERGLTRELLGDWDAVRERYGRDVAAGIGAIGLVCAEALGSRERLGLWVGRSLLPVLPESTAAAGMLGDASRRMGGVERTALQARWWAALQEALEVRGFEVEAIGALDVAIDLAPEPVSNIDVRWRFAESPPANAELYLRPLDPVRGRPVPFERNYRELVVPVSGAEGQAVTWLGPTDSLHATVRVWDERIQGWHISGWTEVGR